MANIFTQVATKKPRSNTFDLSHEKKMSIDMGKLIPSFVMDCFPGDKVNLSSSQMIRFAPMLAPVMHKVKVFQHYFFVPNRLLWDNWQNFITGGEDGNDQSVFPKFGYGTAEATIGSLYDYLGLPLDYGTLAGSSNLNAMPLAAYQLIWNEYYRDQNLQTPAQYKLVDGDNNAIRDTDLAVLRTRAWMHDYFTSALPWTQKGPEATIPLGSESPVKLYDSPGDPAGQGIPTILDYGDRTTTAGAGNVTTAANGGLIGVGVPSGSAVLDPNGTLYADLSQATASSINDLRRAFRLQEWLEKNARGGSRYTESILVHFGVKSSDARLQRPEYLGGGVSPVTFSEVLQTGASPNDTSPYTPTPQANMAGHGISVGTNSGFNYFCEEHGYIIGIMSVMPNTNYFQGIPKHWRKFDKFDYPWPEFANIGEQPIENLELYYAADDPNRTETFGYTPRYAEYKFMSNTVHGEFRDSLEFWHLARKFANPPALNEQFIECVPDKRIFAVTLQDQPSLYVQVFNRVKANRRLPVFGVPTI